MTGVRAWPDVAVRGPARYVVCARTGGSNGAARGRGPLLSRPSCTATRQRHALYALGAPLATCALPKGVRLTY